MFKISQYAFYRVHLKESYGKVTVSSLTFSQALVCCYPSQILHETMRLIKENYFYQRVF